METDTRSAITQALAASQTRTAWWRDPDSCETLSHHGVAALQALDAGDSADARWHLCCAHAVARSIGLGVHWSPAVRAAIPDGLALDR